MKLFLAVNVYCPKCKLVLERDEEDSSLYFCRYDRLAFVVTLPIAEGMEVTFVERTNR